MIEFGKTLREAREARGLTITDIADQTHVMSSIIGQLENEDFSRLPAPIYGRGFVKLYCEAVGIDPAPMIAEFMDIYNGNREPVIRERAVSAAEPAPTVPPVSQPAPEPAAPPPPPPPPPVVEEPPATPLETSVAPESPAVNEQPDLFSICHEPPPVVNVPLAPTPVVSEPVAPAPVAPAPVASAPVAPTPVAEPAAEPAREHVFTRYATPLREHAAEIPRMAPAFGRWLVVLCVLGLVACGVVAGVRALYRATGNMRPSTTPAVQSARPTTNTQAPATVNVKAPARNVKTSRTPIDVPPLYID